MNSTSRVLYFCPVFLLFVPLAARLCWGLHVLPWGGKNLIFFLFFLICIWSNTLSRWINVPVTKSYVMKSRPAFTLNIPLKKKKKLFFLCGFWRLFKDNSAVVITILFTGSCLIFTSLCHCRCPGGALCPSELVGQSFLLAQDIDYQGMGN